MRNSRRDHGRIMGRKGVALRKRRLLKEPLCRSCRRQGKTTPADVIDHIVPLHRGGEDVDENCQALCNECHNDKTLSEYETFGVNNHPQWLKQSAVPLTIVCGPPGSGKTTYARTRMSKGDIIVDLDDILAALGSSQWDGSKENLNAALGIRNAMLGKLANAHGCCAWFIVAAPTRQERAWWANKLGGNVILMDTSEAECKRRCEARQTPLAVKGVDAWFKASRMSWNAPKKPKPSFGEDGWPIE